jgi:hypothetical protein
MKNVVYETPSGSHCVACVFQVLWPVVGHQVVLC